MFSRFWGPFVLLVAIAAPAALASGCRPVSPASAVSSAADQLAEVSTLRFELSAAIESPTTDEESWLTMTGALDFENRRVAFSTRIGDIDFEGRFVDGHSYWLMDGVEGVAPFWVSGEADDDLLDLLESMTTITSFLAIEAGDPVRSLGQETVRDRQARRYSLPLENGEFIDGFPSEGPTTADIWIDSDGWLVRLEFRSSVSPEALPFYEADEATLMMRLEFFDFGLPVSIEAPPLDGPAPADVVRLDPFAGVECYGDRLEECLLPNPELDAMAADPSLCQGDQPHVCLVPIGRVRADVVQAIIDFHRETAGIEIVLLQGLPMNVKYMDLSTSQVGDHEAYALMKFAYEITDETPSTYIGLTAFDIVPSQGNLVWMFGARFGKGDIREHGVFSYFRMANVPPRDARTVSDDMLYERVAKYAGRYVALLHFHYPRGDDPDYLNYSQMSGITDLDYMQPNWPEGPRPAENRLGLP